MFIYKPHVLSLGLFICVSENDIWRITSEISGL